MFRIGDIVGNSINKAIRNIANSIIEDEKIKKEYSSETSNSRKLEILRSQEKIKKLLDDFIHEHGHRGYKEMEFRSPRWEETPNELVALIDIMVTNFLIM